MSIESDFRAAVLTDAALVALIGPRLAVNYLPQESELPYIAYSVQVDREHGLSNVRLGQEVSIELQCWGRTASEAATVADALEAAIYSKTQGLPMARANSFDPELGFDAVVVSAKLLLD
jgi:hypothetical protein